MHRKKISEIIIKPITLGESRIAYFLKFCFVSYLCSANETKHALKKIYKNNHKVFCVESMTMIAFIFIDIQIKFQKFYLMPR